MDEAFEHSERAHNAYVKEPESMTVGELNQAVKDLRELRYELALQYQEIVVKHQNMLTGIDACLELVPHKYFVRVREGGGMEDVEQSLAVTIVKMINNLK